MSDVVQCLYLSDHLAYPARLLAAHLIFSRHALFADVFLIAPDAMIVEGLMIRCQPDDKKEAYERCRSSWKGSSGKKRRNHKQGDGREGRRNSQMSLMR